MFCVMSCWWAHLAGTVEGVVQEVGEEQYLPHCEVGKWANHHPQ